MNAPAAPTPAAAESRGGTRIQGLPDHVVIRQLYLGCLSQASYLVGDARTGRAIAVDPRRDVDEILGATAEEGLAVEMVVETHFHADFLSGHLELAAATGAEIGFGRAGVTEFPSRALADGDVIDLGGVQVRIMETPGHTPESITLAVLPEAGADPVAVLTGDTLFIGDVGRPDLLVAVDVAAEDLAGRLFESLGRVMALPDSTLVLPAHGAGSACGKALSSETVSTIGEQRRTNYAVQPMSQAAFIDMVTEGQPTAPAYFGHDASLNRKERALLDEHEVPPPLDLAGLDAAVADRAVVVDVRLASDFAQGHLVGSLSVSLDGRFAEQVGTVVPFGTSIVLVGDPDAAMEARVRLARIGFDAVVGTLTDVEAVLAAHPARSTRLSRLTADAFVERRDSLGDALQVIDVRNPGEVEGAPVDGARNIPLAKLRDALPTIDRGVPVALLCAGGARSAIASSLLRAEGFVDVSDVLGGANARHRPRLLDPDDDAVIAVVVLGLAIGLALGALGGGGSILAVPVLVHLAGQSVTAATATSLVAVGAAAAVGSVGHAWAGRVRWDAAATFVAVGVLGSWVGAQVNHRVDGDVLLLAFSGLVLVAAHRMLTACPSCARDGEERATAAAADPVDELLPERRVLAVGGATSTPRTVVEPDPPPAPSTSPVSLSALLDDPRHAARVVGAGLLVGFLTGAFGVGGGFVVVPAMTLVLGLSMPVAIGTSLVVVAGNAAVALAIRGLGAVEWDVAVPFTATMLVGSLVGGLVAHRLPAKRSLHAFAVLLVAVAVANGVAAALALAG